MRPRGRNGLGGVGGSELQAQRGQLLSSDLLRRCRSLNAPALCRRCPCPARGGLGPGRGFRSPELFLKDASPDWGGRVRVQAHSRRAAGGKGRLGEFRTIGEREKTQPTGKTPPDPGRPRGVPGKGRGWWAGPEGGAGALRPQQAGGGGRSSSASTAGTAKQATLSRTPGKPAPRLRLRGVPGEPELERLGGAPSP